jgi:hypothetical protein
MDESQMKRATLDAAVIAPAGVTQTFNKLVILERHRSAISGD